MFHLIFHFVSSQLDFNTSIRVAAAEGSFSFVLTFQSQFLCADDGRSDEKREESKRGITGVLKLQKTFQGTKLNP
jgi:hypothetical protein